MGTTIRAPSIWTAVPSVIAPIVQIKQGWQDLWQTAPELLLDNVSTAAAGQDLSRLTFRRPYGYAKDTYQAAYTLRTPLDLTDWWIRVRSVGGGFLPILTTVWLGRISGEDTTPFASSDVPAGVQTWVAYGPAQILRKRMVGTSYHIRAGQVQELGWVPPMNDPEKSEVGNRSADKLDDVYMYGGTDVWTNRQYTEYLIRKFLDESEGGTSPVGPQWTLAGQADALDQFWSVAGQNWGGTQTVEEMLRKLIPLNRGLDYTIRIIDSHTPSEGPDIPEAGFEIFVYALATLPATFGGKTLPSNTALVDLDAGTSRDLSPSPRIVITHDHVYRRIRVLGKRIVVCCSLWADKAPGVALLPDAVIGVPSHIGDAASSFPSLIAKWDEDIETTYRAGAVGKTDEADHDEFRRQDKFLDVYQSFGAPGEWDLNSGTAAPRLDDLGELMIDDPDTEDENEAVADYQLTMRRTLTWIPLKEGEDWTNIATAGTLERGVPTDVDDHQADYLPPIAWVFDPATFSFVDSSTLGVGVQPKRHDWGVLLRASPNHIMGKNHFGDVGGTDKTATWPRYDWREMAVTIAFESDQRYAVEWASPDATNKDGVLEIEVDAELHYLAPNTIVATPYPDSTPAVVLSGDEGRVIRRDRDVMVATMVEAISRYGYARRRASVAVKGLMLWHDLVGQILSTIDESGVSHVVNGPICEVAWNIRDSTTIIKAGYAT